MEIVWINGTNKEDSRVFDSDFEASEWADGLHPDFVPFLVEKMNVGYATPDVKVINHLEYLLPTWAGHNDMNVAIKKEKTIIGNQVIYKIWTEKN